MRTSHAIQLFVCFWTKINETGVYIYSYIYNDIEKVVLMANIRSLNFEMV